MGMNNMEWNKDLQAPPENARIVVKTKWGNVTGTYKPKGTVSGFACDCLDTEKGMWAGKIDGWMLESDYAMSGESQDD